MLERLSRFVLVVLPSALVCVIAVFILAQQFASKPAAAPFVERAAADVAAADDARAGQRSAVVVVRGVVPAKERGR